MTCHDRAYRANIFRDLTIAKESEFIRQPSSSGAKSYNGSIEKNLAIETKTIFKGHP